jgi:ATP/ADP translocase
MDYVSAILFSIMVILYMFFSTANEDDLMYNNKFSRFMVILIAMFSGAWLFSMIEYIIIFSKSLNVLT